MAFKAWTSEASRPSLSSVVLVDNFTKICKIQYIASQTPENGKWASSANLWHCCRICDLQYRNSKHKTRRGRRVFGETEYHTR